MRIAASDGIHSAEVFAVPTSVMVTLHNNMGGTFSEIKRAYGRRINLEKVIACDRLAVDFIENKKQKPRMYEISAAASGGGSVTKQLTEEEVEAIRKILNQIDQG